MAGKSNLLIAAAAIALVAACTIGGFGLLIVAVTAWITGRSLPAQILHTLSAIGNLPWWVWSLLILSSCLYLLAGRLVAASERKGR